MTNSVDEKRDYETIDRSVKRLIADHLGIPAAALPIDADIAADLGADSLDRLELIMTIEERFGIDIPQDKLQDLKSVTDLIELVAKLRTST